MSETHDTAGIEELLQYLKQTRGFDFSGYKRSSLVRRIRKRMQEINIDDYSNYVDYLEVRPDEFTLLFNTILINVTSFFRDEASWEFIASDIIPRILAAKIAGQTIRIWSAGCASGQETYTLAMLLAEAMGLEQVRDRVKIYATDADEDALNYARQALYDAREIESVPPALIEKYFDPTGDRYCFHKDLRRSVIFGRHDLVQDAPISRVDLLSCRNTLMYFNSETQERVLARFHFALNDGGFLYLGKSETLLTHSNTFAAIDLRRRIFAKVQRHNFRDRLLLLNQAGGEPVIDQVQNQARLREAASDSIPVAQIVVDKNSYLVSTNMQARSLFGLVSRDIGCPLRDLDVSYRPIELRSLVDECLSESRAISVKEVPWPNPSSEMRCFDVELVPLAALDGRAIGVSITFTDTTRYRRLQDDLERTNQELETTLEELQSTNEELETTNEELQSTVEELETTNEELQSTNEELETMNEELQSTNEELQTINDELRMRSGELNNLNSFLESILTSVRGGVIVIDRELHVLVWNLHSENMWGLRSEEVIGKHLLNLDIGLPIEQLKVAIRDCLAGDCVSTDMQVEATNRRGKVIQCQVRIAPLLDAPSNPDRSPRGVLLMVEEATEGAA